MADLEGLSPAFRKVLLTDPVWSRTVSNADRHRLEELESAHGPNTLQTEPDPNNPWSSGAQHESGKFNDELRGLSPAYRVVVLTERLQRRNLSRVDTPKEEPTHDHSSSNKHYQDIPSPSPTATNSENQETP